MAKTIKIGTRKLYDFGGSVAIGIPADFIKGVGAEKGDEVEIFSNGDDELTLRFPRKVK